MTMDADLWDEPEEEVEEPYTELSVDQMLGHAVRGVSLPAWPPEDD